MRVGLKLRLEVADMMPPLSQGVDPCLMKSCTNAQAGNAELVRLVSPHQVENGERPGAVNLTPHSGQKHGPPA